MKILIFTLILMFSKVTFAETWSYIDYGGKKHQVDISINRVVGGTVTLPEFNNLKLRVFAPLRRISFKADNFHSSGLAHSNNLQMVTVSFREGFINDARQSYHDNLNSENACPANTEAMIWFWMKNGSHLKYCLLQENQ